MFRVQFLGGRTPSLGFSPLFFLNHFRALVFVYFYFGFGIILKKPSTRGPHSTLELSLEHFSSQICFVSLTLTLISSYLFHYYGCNRHDFDRFVGCNE